MKIVIIATYGLSLLNFRGKLISEWVKEGHDVTCVSVEPMIEMKESIAELGARYYQINGSRTGTSISEGIRMIFEYSKLFKSLRPNICFLYMSKPIAYGGFAARLQRIENINIMISGLEIAFYKTDLKNRVVRIILILLYKFSCKNARNVFFQNPDDKAVFIKYGIVKENQCMLVSGSGVDMKHFVKQPMPEGDDVVLMVGRLVRYKGIYDFVKAAEILKNRYPKVKFQVLGDFDNNSDSMSKKEMQELVSKGIIDYLGFVEDVRPILGKCTIFVLPSQFEGVPRSTLEAMATGRPIITTDAPGCRETVISGYNGFLVEYGDYKGLAEKIKVLLENHLIRNEFSRNSFLLCKQKYEVHKVNAKILDKMFL